MKLKLDKHNFQKLKKERKKPNRGLNYCSKVGRNMRQNKKTEKCKDYLFNIEEKENMYPFLGK